MKNLSRTAAALAGLALAAGTLAACGGDDASADKPVLRVGVQKDGIRAVLDQAGLLKDLDYTIEWSEFAAGPPIVEAAAADQIDVAWVGSTPPIFGAANGADFKVVAAVQEADKRENSILVPKGSKITSVADLKGKEIALGRGTSAQGVLIKSLEKAGLGLDDVTPNYLAPGDGLAAFKAGEVDAWVVWDPFVTQALQEFDAVALPDAETVDNALQFEIASTKAVEDEATKKLIVDFVDRLDQAFAWAGENPDAWGEAWAKDSGLSPTVTKQVARNKKSDLFPVNDYVISESQQLADLFQGAGEFKNKVDFKSIVVDGIAK
ncbi:ABC transporter substrate-binding protein [Nocardioides yefusunii]|uniref:ABC transporter substrate-binding protein n=1 Tax=Nocardioides yefusunii TaxID=2500546 RepID=A0ABW1QXA8_9ACTN|nr:ABC transporter substrate-binding protein [Nocardioides yefusunii]